MALLLPCLNMPLVMPCAALLSVHSGAAGCGCPSSASAALAGRSSLALMNSAAAYASAADAMACLATFAMAEMSPLLAWLLLLGLLPKNVYPPARGLAIGAAKHAAPEWLRRAMPLALRIAAAPGLAAQ